MLYPLPLRLSEAVLPFLQVVPEWLMRPASRTQFLLQRRSAVAGCFQDEEGAISSKVDYLLRLLSYSSDSNQLEGTSCTLRRRSGRHDKLPGRGLATKSGTLWYWGQRWDRCTLEALSPLYDAKFRVLLPSDAATKLLESGIPKRRRTG